MLQTYFEKYNSQAAELFDEIKTTLQYSGDSSVASKAALIPSCLSEKDKRIEVVFAGQYGAGKSTLLSIMTGQKLDIGGGITTKECQPIEWQGITVIDTPGIHTQNRPDHDSITYNQLAKADLIVFVLTAEGFSDHLANHFRKLINEKGKGHEMMLVINKMDRTAAGNTPDQQKVLIEKDILPVIEPYSIEDMYTSFLCTDWYNQALMPKFEKYREKLLAKSGIETFYKNLNQFISDKGLLGTSTTSLYEVEKILSEIVSNMKTGDAIVDGTIHMLNLKRQSLEEIIVKIKEKSNASIQKFVFQVQGWGNDIANELTSTLKQEETNRLLAEKQKAVDDYTEILTNEIENILKIEAENLKKKFKELSDTEYARDLKSLMQERVKRINISDKSKQNLQKAGDLMKDIGSKIALMSVGKKSGDGFMSVFKTSTYAGSKLHENVLQVGHLFKHKLKPWEAVRWTKNIANGARILGVVGSVLSIGLQIYNDKQEEKIESELREGRNEIRTCFRDVSNVVDLQYDKATDTWIQENIRPIKEQIDSDIEEINNNIKTHNDLYLKLSELLRRVRKLISEIQSA
jgi:small GTP-binding protein